MIGHWFIPLFQSVSAPIDPEPDPPQKTGGALRVRPAWIVPQKHAINDDIKARQRRNAALLFAVVLR